MNKKAIQKATETLGRDYQKWIKSIVVNYKQTQIKCAVKVNAEILCFYWHLGKDIHLLQKKNKYGSGFYEAVSNDLARNLPDIKSFSPRNLRYMERFYTLYNIKTSKLPQAVAKSPRQKEHVPQIMEELVQVPWGHHRFIIDKCNSNTIKALFYIRKTIENGWSRAVLLNMMDANVYESSDKAQNNFSTALPKEQNDIAQEIVKDPYHFDFLCFSKDYKEADLQKGLEENICKYLLELGKGFAFVGRQVRLEVGGDEYFCDQLFYHIKLKCYVVVELKIVKFEPEFVSKLNFYCNAVNHLIKAPEENDTIGLLICKKKNDLVVQWTVEKNMEPIAITSYELSQIMDASLNGR